MFRVIPGQISRIEPRDAGSCANARDWNGYVGITIEPEGTARHSAWIGVRSRKLVRYCG